MLTSSTTRFSPDLDRSHIDCEPVGVWHSVANDTSTIAKESNIVFRLTPNRGLAIAGFHSNSFDGSMVVERFRQTLIELVPGLAVTFDKHYAWHSDKSLDTITRFGFPVATTKAVGDLHDPAQIEATLLPKLDDFLVLASLASTHRCICVGWEVFDENNRVSRYCRGGIGRPSRRIAPVMNTGLIPLAHFQEFVSRAWPLFQNSPYLEAIRSAIYSIVPMRTKTIESDYLSMFAALEELVLTYRRLHDKEMVIPQVLWKNVEAAIKDAIKTKLVDSDKAARSMLYDNLGGVNRVPLRRALEEFVSHFQVDLTDLWPLYSGDGDGLGSIRNKLVHGDLDSSVSIGSLAIAAQHLRWSLERIVLTILEWPIQKTEVSPGLLARHSTDMKRLKEARTEMSRLLKRQP